MSGGPAVVAAEFNGLAARCSCDIAEQKRGRCGQVRHRNGRTLDAYVEHLARRHADALAAQYRREAAAIADFPRFERYFRAFLNALPWPLRRVLPTTVFAVGEAERKRYWLVNFRTRRIEEAGDDGAGRIVVFVPALIINDCVRKRMFAVWTPSKRLRIRLRSVGIARYVFMMALLGRYTNCGEISLRSLLGRRRLSVGLRRWREPFSLAWALIETKITRRVRSVADLYRLSRRPHGRDPCQPND